jgi:hypothetical protein
MSAPYHTPAGTPMFTELTGYGVELDRVSIGMDTLVAGLADEQAQWRPAPRRWSIVENVDHLTTTGRVYLPAFDDAVDVARSRSLYREGPFRYGVLERLMAWSMEPPIRFRLRNPRSLTPGPLRPLDDAMRDFHALQRELRDRIRGANGLDLSVTKVRSPLARWLVLSMGAAFRILRAHERRHLWQAQNVRVTRGFPGA